MLEKLKDFFYDFSDTLLSLSIILIMALVITWKLTGAMSIAIFDNENDVPKVVQTEKTEFAGEDVVDIDNSTLQENANQDNITDPPAKPDNSTEIVQVGAQNIEVEIPRGSSGSSIATILLDKGLIASKGDFLNRVEEKGLGPKLRFGNFTIKSGSSVDQIISIITGIS